MLFFFKDFQDWISFYIHIYIYDFTRLVIIYELKKKYQKRLTNLLYILTHTTCKEECVTFI